MYTIEIVSRSFIYWLRQHVHESYEVREGELYGITLDNKNNNNNSVVVTVNDIEEGYLELGTNAISSSVFITMNSKSKRQRDATSSMLLDSIKKHPIYVYNNFTQYTPTEDAVSRGLRIETYSLKNMPEPTVADPNLFWVSVLFLSITVSI